MVRSDGLRNKSASTFPSRAFGSGCFSSLRARSRSSSSRRRRSPAAEAEKETRALYRLDGTDRARRTDELRDAADVLEKAVGLDDVEDGFHEGAGERAAAEGRAQASHRCVARDLLGREHRSHGKTGGESFRGREGG